MPSRDQVHYFGAGPAPLPTPVLEEASKVLLNYNDSGIGITEISHRSPEANAILANTKDCLRQLLDIPTSDGPDGYEILFLQGGGSGEFSATAYHMMSLWVGQRWKEIGGDINDPASIEKMKSELKSMRLDYLITGSWTLKASQEAARLMGPEYVNIATDARKENNGRFGTIPDESTWSRTSDSKNCAMTYYCDNETVDGVEFPFTPSGPNLVADMSSNFLSRPVDVKAHAAIFGGAQKNVGTTGITIAIISNRLLPPHGSMADPKLLRQLGLSVGPVVLDWPTIAKNNSLYNTLPIFDVWIAGKVMERLLQLHAASAGAPRIAGQEDESNGKAAMLYRVLDNSGDVFKVVPDMSCRSRMNICFRVKGGDEAAEKAFLKGAEERGLKGVKGHRSVGGMRASNYNAVGVESMEKLVRWCEEFAGSYGE